MKILAVIVNYKAAEYCIAAVKSILRSIPQSISKSILESVDNSNSDAGSKQYLQKEKCKGVADNTISVEIAVVDNSMDGNQAAILENGLDNHVHLIVNRENKGFGRACNQVFDMFDSDFVLLLNPDARLLPGALIHMCRALVSHPDIAAVSPRIYWDDNCEYLLPPAMPFWFSSFVSGLAGNSCMLRGLSSRLWQKYAVKYWQVMHPFSVSNMSGGAVLLKRESVIKSGGLFDKDFFLYYEDTDLFLRLKKNGYTLLMEPAAGAVHYYDQCGKDDILFKRKYMAASEKIFYKKHMTSAVRVSKRIAKISNCLSLRISALKKFDFYKNFVEHGRNGKGDICFSAPFVIDVPSGFGEKWLFEWSPDPFFLTAAAKFGTGGQLCFSKDEWEMLCSGVYYGRFTCLSGAEPYIRYLCGVEFSNRFFMWIKE